eukprot:g38965.t1
MFDCIASEGGEGAVDPSRALMVGDRLETDILFGANCGMWTVLALTGVSSLQDVHAKMASELPQHKKMVPDFYLPCNAFMFYISLLDASAQVSAVAYGNCKTLIFRRKSNQLWHTMP